MVIDRNNTFESDPGKVPNDLPPDQKRNVGPDPVNAGAQPQPVRRDANSPAFQPSPAAIQGDMETGGDPQRPSFVPVKAAGDLAAGGYAGGNDRTPKVKGL